MASNLFGFTLAQISDSDACPCGAVGGNRSYGQCCGPLHRGQRQATTAVELMAARYSAYAAHEANYLWTTWHPRNRPDFVDFDPEVRWLGLEILDQRDGGEADREGSVEFVATFRDRDGRAQMHEKSRFLRRAKRWVYVDGEVDYR